MCVASGELVCEGMLLRKHVFSSESPYNVMLAFSLLTASFYYVGIEIDLCLVITMQTFFIKGCLKRKFLLFQMNSTIR